MANKVVDDYEWSQEKCLQLIREYRARPLFWNYSYDTTATSMANAWNEIGKKLNANAGTCKHKIDFLLSFFQREKAKIAAHIRDKKQAYKSNWFAFQELEAFLTEDQPRYITITPGVSADYSSTYLKRKVTPNLKRRNNMAINSNEEISQVPPILNITQFSTEKELTQVPLFINDTQPEHKAPKPKLRRKQYPSKVEKINSLTVAFNSKKETPQVPHYIKITQSKPATEIPNVTPSQDEIAHALPPIINITQTPTAAQIVQEQPLLMSKVTQLTSTTDEEITSFTTFIASKMKKFSERTKNEVQKEICEIIFRAGRGFYERPTKTPSTVVNAGNSNNTNINLYSSVGVNNEIVIKTEYSDGEY